MKGAHAEEEYYLKSILSGSIVKSYMSVTKIKQSYRLQGGVLQSEDG